MHAVPTVKTEVEASRSDARMATEALRRLRKEIDAAFEAQRRPRNEERRVVTSSETLTPKWAEVTKLLASVGRSPVKKATIDTTGHVSRPSHFNREGEARPLTAIERQEFLRKFVGEWRQITHSAGVITRFHVRARRRQNQRLAVIIFNKWRRRVLYQLRLKSAVNFVKRQKRSTDLVVAWRIWVCTQRRAVMLREFWLKRRRRLSCEAFCAWVLVASRRGRFRKYKRRAEIQLLRRFWRWLRAAIEAQRRINVEVKDFIEQRIVDLTQRAFLRWCGYVEEHMRWKFAVRWSERRILGDAYDSWREVHEDTRRKRHTLQLAIRRQRRCALRVVLKVWNMYTQRALEQKRTLAAVFHSQQCRNAFTQLVLNAQYDRQRAYSLQVWKTRRTIWMWLHRSNRHRALRLRAAFLKEHHERLILRTAAWRPWQRVYLRSTSLRKFMANQRVRRLRKSWMALVDAVNQQQQQRLMAESIVDSREVRQLRLIIGAWHIQTKSDRKFQELVARSEALWRQGLMQKVMSCWKEAQRVARREEYCDELAMTHITRRMVEHWAKWASWSRRELRRKIALVKERRQRRQIQQIVGHWRQTVLDRQRELCINFFSAWKVGVDMQHRERHLLELRRLIQLRRRWQRWGLVALHCQGIREKAKEVRNLREQRLKRWAFVTVWLRKTRRYELGSNVLSVLSKQHTLQHAISRWRENQFHLGAVKLADAFYREKLQKHCLELLYVVTIGHRRTAIAYDKRRYLVWAFDYWSRYFMLRQRRREAERYFRRRTKQKAVHLLRVTAANSIVRRDQRLEAEAWHEVVVLQRVLSKWLIAAKQVRCCWCLGQRLTWNVVGRRAFRLWQDGLVEKQKHLKAVQFYASVLVSRSWNALLRVTKRRQVALAMWTHTMVRIRLEHVLVNWKLLVDSRRGQYAVVSSMRRMQEQRIQQSRFTAWNRLVAAQRMALRHEQRESLTWRRVCWSCWKLWRVSCRWQRSQQLMLMKNTFHQGLKRYAIQQQACREICVQTARNLLCRSLVRWRVEWWLVCNQKKVATEAKRKALTHWKTFVAGCSQQRRYEYYIQQLHRSQTRHKPTPLNDKYRTGGPFRDTRALQAQLKRNRVLMTHVLHAWYLVVRNHRRHMELAMSSSKKLRRRQATELHFSSSKPRRKALEFWATRMMQKCFDTWSKHTRGKQVEPA